MMLFQCTGITPKNLLIQAQQADSKDMIILFDCYVRRRAIIPYHLFVDSLHAKSIHAQSLICIEARFDIGVAETL